MKEGWQTKTVGEVCEVMNGGTPKTGVPEYWDGVHRWITPAEMGKRISPYVSDTERKITELGLRNSSARMLPPNSVVLSSRAPIGHLVINTEPMATNQGCKGLIPSSQIETKFLYYYLRSIVDLLNSLGTGATFKELSGSKLKEVTVPIPPLAEQQRIVGLLDEAFEGLAIAKANAEKNLQNARALLESHLQSVFTQRGPGWVERKLGELIEIQNGYAFKSTDYTDAGFFVIRISNVQDGEITLANPRFIRLADNKLQRFILNAGDILISLTGNIGRVGIIQENQLPAVLNQRVARITIKDESADRDFIYRFLLSRTFRESLQEAGHGAAQQNVSTKDIESVRLSLPNKAEQRSIVDGFENFAAETQRLTRIYEQKLAALEALKKSLLHQAFSGNL